MLIFFLATVAWASSLPPSPSQCSSISRRAPCGQPTDSPLTCATKKCCYDATAGNNSCFFAAEAVPITKVHVIQACHFDAGYLSTTSDILNRWFHIFFPQALTLGLELDARGGAERLHFMAQSWIVSLFLDCPPGLPGLVCPTPQEVANFTAAVKAKYITWHAFPFNGEPELMTSEIFSAALSLTHALDARFGLPPKATLSQRDVPGLTRAVIPALTAGGVKALSIGVNPWSTPPMVPRAFMWRDNSSGTALPAFWHPYFYGGIAVTDAVILPGLGEAIVFDWRGDNAGPPASVAEVVQDFATIASEFPGAQVVASTLDDFVALLTPEILAQLPVFDTEIGDTWLHGAASDPLKTAKNKRAARAYADCIAPGGACHTSPDSPPLLNFTRLLMKNGEHTWGESLGHYKDLKNWSNAQFNAARASDPGYASEIIASWEEQREYGLEAALGALTGSGHPLGGVIQSAWADLTVQGPPSLDGWSPSTPGVSHTVGGWSIGFDKATGAIGLLVEENGSVVWANASSGDGSLLALAEYHTYGAADVLAWETAYNLKGPNAEFGRDASMAEASPVTSVTRQRLVGLWERESGGGMSFLAQADFGGSDAGSLHTLYGAPSEVFVQVDVGGEGGQGGGSINISVTLVDKTPTRLLEALFLRFNVSAGGGGGREWRVNKLASMVDPFVVQSGGNQRHHGVNEKVTVGEESQGQSLDIGAPDVSIAAFGVPSIFPIPVDTPAERNEGVSFLLWGNLWNTNYPMWYPFHTGDENIRLRFTVE